MNPENSEIEFVEVKKRGRQSQKLQKLLSLQKYVLSKQEDVETLLQLRSERKVLFVGFLKGGEASDEFLSQLKQKISLPIDATYQSTGAIANSLENHLKKAVRVTSVHVLRDSSGRPLKIKYNGQVIELKATAVDY